MAASSQLLHPEGREEDKPGEFQKRLMTWVGKVQSSTWFLLQLFPILGKVGRCHFPFFAGGWKKESSPCSVFHCFCLFHFSFTGGQSWEISLQHRHSTAPALSTGPFPPRQPPQDGSRDPTSTTLYKTSTCSMFAVQ